MKRLIGLVVFLAAALSLGYWVHTHHNGNLYAAWTPCVAREAIRHRTPD